MKKNIKNIGLKSIFILILTMVMGCQDFLQEDVYTQYDPDSFLKDQKGVDALLVAVYSRARITGYDVRNLYNILGEFPTDIALESGGGLNRQVVPIMQFTWDPSTGFFGGVYNKYYGAIARANTVLSVVESLSDISQESVDKIVGEARFLRGLAYYILHNVFGPTPIIEIPSGASADEIEKIGKETPRATEEAYRAYVEADFLFAVNALGTGGISSRANKGTALALLSKFYLNNKQWDKAAATSQQVLDLNYSLYSDYTKMFSVAGENNNEYIYRFEALVDNGANVYMAHAFPPSYPLEGPWANFGAQFRTYTSFYETFEPQDVRRQLFVTEYIKPGTTVTILLNRDGVGNPLDNARSFKYTPDPEGTGQSHGNDVPYVRLADIILTKAEALNELNGPNAEGIGLINQIRNRANATSINLVDYTTKEALREFILAERGREFYTEGLRREDLIRHGKFIEQAQNRGVSGAKAHHVLYPIPQAQIDNNPNLVQNDGYN